jgi:hypothetical protein
MGRSVFVSYKYSDSKVASLPNLSEPTRARHYVDKLYEILTEAENIYKGEDDGEDLSSLHDATIGSKLGDKIFYSSVTIVLISKGMKEEAVPEKDQWIPWEVSYSLKEQSRAGGRSTTNAVLAVVLPDKFNDYSYYINFDPYCKSRNLDTSFLFQIIRENMFNRKAPDTRECNGKIIYHGHSSFIESVKWEDFVIDPNKYIDIALENRKNINEFEIVKKLK